MAEIIVMPKLSDTMEEGVLATWLKGEGDSVEEGDIIAEIETDKATMEYESPVDGKILKLVIEPGTKVDLGVPIAVVGGDDEAFDQAMLKGADESQKSDAESNSAATPSPSLEKTPEKTDVSRVSHEVSSGRRLKASPLAKKIAADRGIDLSQVGGSGPGGRIVLKDVENYQPASQGRVSGISQIDVQDNQIKVSMMRQTIAKRLHAAKNEAPHFYLTRSIDMAATLAWRKKLNAQLEKHPDLPKVSVNDIVLMACAKALRQHPNVNASWQGETITEFGHVHVAMAVALPTGLITPVIRDCDRLGVREIAVQSRSLAISAKKGELKPEDYTGGTFTVSNLGMFGIEEFTAIINPPQAGILAVGATVATPCVNAKGEVVVAQRMKVTMSCDHRVIDGALGAQYLRTFVGLLEDPLMMLV